MIILLKFLNNHPKEKELLLLLATSIELVLRKDFQQIGCILGFTKMLEKLKKLLFATNEKRIFLNEI